MTTKIFWIKLITDVTHPLNNAVYSRDVEPPQGLVVIVTLKTYAGSFKLWTKIMDKNYGQKPLRIV